MAKSLQLKIAIAFYLAVLQAWGTYAYAASAETDLAKGLEAIPFQSIKYVLLFCMIGGAAGTLNKIANPQVLVARVWLEVLKDLVCALAAGMVTFFLVSWTGIAFWLQAALITLAGVGGSKALDIMVTDGFFPWIGRVFGRVAQATPPTKEDTTP